MTLRNLSEEKGEKLSDLISVKAHQVVSMALSRSDHVQMTLLSFGAGESVSEEAYGGDTMYLVIEGKCQIVSGEEKILLSKDEALKVPAGKLHALIPQSDLKILQISVFD